MEARSVALDGPAGAGKSTLARMAANKFGLIYVDTGALYRCIGLYALRSGVSPKDRQGVEDMLPGIKLEMRYDEQGVQRMILGGEDVTDNIRLPEVSGCASEVSAIPAVRKYLLSMQREMAMKYDVIMDGRDIGTVVLPDAGLKIFLTADPGARARRRYRELLDKSIETTFEVVLSDMQTRDENDSTRKEAPLRAAYDAVMLDTTDLDLDESFAELCRLISERYGI